MPSTDRALDAPSIRKSLGANSVAADPLDSLAAYPSITADLTERMTITFS